MTGGAREPSFPTFVPTSAALIRHVADAWGERPFVALGGERLTYAEVERRSARLAKGMLASGVGKGTRVGLLAPNGPDWVVAWFAATRIGAVAVMLNTYNKAAELARTLRHGDVALLVTIGAHLGTDYLDRVEAAAGGLAEQRHRRLFVTELPYLRSVWAIDAAPRRWCGRLDDLAARGDDVPDAVLAAVEAEVHPSDPMVIVYSSGSTAEPKGAVHTHGGVVRHSHNLNQMRDLRSDDVLYTPMPLFWVGGFSFTLVAAMHADVRVARPLGGARRHAVDGARPGRSRRGRRTSRHVARHDRDARPTHLRHHRRPAGGQHRKLRPVGAGRGASGGRPRDRNRRRHRRDR